MSAKPLAVYVSPGYQPWLESFPFRAEVLAPPPGICDLPALLEERGLKPDLLVQDETLSPRVLLKGLETLECPKVFWSMDPHLNHAWQAPYCALFDAVASTQKAQVGPISLAARSCVQALATGSGCGPGRPDPARAEDARNAGSDANGCLTVPHPPHPPGARQARTGGLPGQTATSVVGPRVAWIPWAATVLPWRPHGERAYPALFVGRVSAHRPLRRLFVERLTARYPLRLEGDTPHHLVQQAYAQARLVPNEAIQGEINERLFTAAGAGCLVLEPGRDNGLEELFEPGREVAVYAHALELEALLDRFLARPGEAEAMGRAARERVLREHQPGHRLEALGRLALESPRGAARGPAGEALFWQAAGRCLESDLLTARPEEVLGGLARFRENPDCLCVILSLLTAAGQARDALHLALSLASQGFAPGHALFGCSACALALRQGEFELARSLAGGLTRSLGKDPARARGPSPAAPPAETPADLWAELALHLEATGQLWRPGFPYDPARHLPATAFEFLDASLRLRPDNLPVLRRIETLLRGLPGSELFRLGYLSELSLRDRQDCLLSLSLGLTGLTAFRVPEALDELALARSQARAQGKGALFERLLAAQDRDGSIRAALGAVQSTD